METEHLQDRAGFGSGTGPSVCIPLLLRAGLCMGCPDPRGPRGTRVSAAGNLDIGDSNDGKKETSPCRSPGTCHLETDEVSGLALQGRDQRLSLRGRQGVLELGC